MELVNIGLGEQEEEMTITFAKNNRSGGFVSDVIRPKAEHVTEKINIDSLDHFMRTRSEVIDFIKIDVEGFEGNVIRGALHILKTHKPIVVLELNHFCLDVLRRITVPDFLDFLREVFPFLYAVDSDNIAIMNLHDEREAYHVMHEHIVKNRYPNLVGAFDPSISDRLDSLKSISSLAKIKRIIPAAERAYSAKLVEGIDFSRPGYPDFIAEVIGMSGHEVWGRWSEGATVIFRFKNPLPSSFTLVVTASPFGPNIGQPIKVSIGSSRKEFALSNAEQTINLDFTLSTPTNQIQFQIPQPISPQELKMSEDHRKLGIGFIKLQIKTK